MPRVRFEKRYREGSGIRLLFGSGNVFFPYIKSYVHPKASSF
jgi:hypothetical protein